MKFGKQEKIALTVVLAACGLVLLLLLQSGASYRMVDDLMAAPEQFKDKRVRVHGWVRAGTLAPSGQSSTAFTLEKGGAELVVVHYGSVPDTLKDNAEVVAEGQLVKRGEDYMLKSNKLTAKCPSKYEGAPKNRDIF